MATTGSRSTDRVGGRPGFALPDVLDHVAAEIDDSRKLLRLSDDWDDAGSLGYAEPTWDRATGFLVETVTRLWRDHGIAVDGADVFPGSRGSIDVEMRAAGRRLLVSIPADAAISARYLGHARTGERSRGPSTSTGPTTDSLGGWLGDRTVALAWV